MRLSQLTPIPRAFYNRDPRIVGRDLLGKVLLRREGRATLAGRIVECEAYLGAGDPAAHSASGKTARNAVLFGPPGYAYVYFIYGNHWCLNVSCLPDGEAGGILFRALEPLAGIDRMAATRQLEPSQLRLIASGPGRLAEALAITRQRDNGKDFASPKSDLRIVDDGFHVENIQESPRIGIRKAMDLPLRYTIDGSPFISGKRP
ncbi:MAG TPA: DNA-3-methyladenine glycosylase [Candidatus Koribacter sp.]|jgi:DNA-3-methyladenine glycosylase